MITSTELCTRAKNEFKRLLLESKDLSRKVLTDVVWGNVLFKPLLDLDVVLKFGNVHDLDLTVAVLWPLPQVTADVCLSFYASCRQLRLAIHILIPILIQEV